MSLKTLICGYPTYVHRQALQYSDRLCGHGKDRDAEALNDPVSVDDLAYLLKYDSTQGRFSGEVTVLKHSAER